MTQRTALILGVGGCLGALAVGGLIAYYSMPLAFLISAITSAAALIIMLMCIEPPLSGRARVEPPLGQLWTIVSK